MAAREKKVILLIDDDTSLLLTLSDFLIHEGYDVVTANSGEQGLKRLREAGPDLIILDMSMPGMGGVGFLREISAELGTPSHPVLVLTARANMADFFANVEVDGFIAKPCDPNDLLLEVGRIIFLRSSQGQAVGVDAPQTGAGRILLGEDDPQVARDITRLFGRAGLEVQVIPSGPELIEKALQDRPALILTKRILSRMNGDVVAELLHKMPSVSGIPVVLYDATAAGHLPTPDYARAGIGVQRFLRTQEAAELLQAARALLKA